MLPVFIFCQGEKNETILDYKNMAIKELYIQNTIYLKSSYWTGLKIMKNGEAHVLSDYVKKNFYSCPSAYNKYKLSRRNSYISFGFYIFSAVSLGLTAGKNTPENMVPVYGITSIGLILVGGYFQNKAYNQLNESIWEYNRFTLVKN